MQILLAMFPIVTAFYAASDGPPTRLSGKPIVSVRNPKPNSRVSLYPRPGGHIGKSRQI